MSYQGACCQVPCCLLLFMQMAASICDHNAHMTEHVPSRLWQLLLLPFAYMASTSHPGMAVVRSSLRDVNLPAYHCS